jgi:hypothetical protein
MRVHTRLIIDIASGEVLHEEGFEYQGPVAQCGGGGKKPPTPTPPPDPPEPGKAPTVDTPGKRKDRRRGYAAMIATGPRGLSSAAPTTSKTLLGQ